MLGDRIRRVRKALTLTQTEFAEKIGIRHSTISDWESGKAIPKESSLISIELRYNVNPEWLREGVGDMFKPEAMADITPEIINIIAWIKSLPPKEQAWLDIEMQDKIRKYKEWLQASLNLHKEH